MAPQTSLTERISSFDLTTVDGVYFRHAAPNRDAFAGGIGGRWGASFPVIYLGRPEASTVIEAYRHLVEDAGVAAEHVKARILYTVRVRAIQILDLTDPDIARMLGLGPTELESPVGDYAACQDVAAAAHQLRVHGILAPAAHRLGTTLALFSRNLSVEELPQPISDQMWERLPADPRTLRTLDEAQLSGTDS